MQGLECQRDVSPFNINRIIGKGMYDALVNVLTRTTTNYSCDDVY